jgi:hypothetical protein
MKLLPHANGGDADRRVPRHVPAKETKKLAEETKKLAEETKRERFLRIAGARVNRGTEHIARLKTIGRNASGYDYTEADVEDIARHLHEVVDDACAVLRAQGRRPPPKRFAFSHPTTDQD